ncbi:MAG TPA: preprotein translocase subunit SecA [Candidatus Dormibacteraeota bacterium]|nr:preprotein translocase subunit SecA [Candidatus Dormibacteraeota bacterium]
MVVLTKLLDPNEREVKRHLAVAAAVNGLEPELQELDDEALKARSKELRERASEGHDLDELLVEAFALCREAGRRTIGLRHFDVQLVGGIVLHQGKIAEMKTGEGKTLVASLALYLNALAGKGAHLVTVNDYLARRDAGWMGPIYHALGMTVGVNVGNVGTFLYDPEFLDETHPDPRLQHLRPVSKKDAYGADITYATNSELAFDYLRDNMARDLSMCSQRDLTYAIVDEVDSILIDEARTPHIISDISRESTDKYYQYARWAARLQEGEDYEVDLKHKSASLTEEGIAKMERWTGIKNIYDLENVIEAHQINQALKAKALFLRDRDYLVKDGEVIIVDEFTGRTMPGRRWSDGLHQAVEAKEGVKVQQEQKTIATITVQNYFRQYDKLAGMTGTAVTEAEEFHKIYGLDVVVIPTHRKMVRADHADLIYKTEKSKFEAVIDEIIEMNKQGRPVLVGTVSVEKSERLAKMLERRGLKHNVLNAKQHEREAAIVAEAGQANAVTIATNMAGRGTDIVLGPGVTDSGGLHIIGTERHESRRIDNQLRGRAGRQGDPGSSRFFISLEDDLMKIFGPAGERIARLMETMEVEPIEHPWVSRSIATAQKKVEGMHFDARKYVVEYDDVMNKQRQIVYAERRKVLEGADARDNILGYVRDIIQKGVDQHCQSRHAENWDLEGLVKYLSGYLPIAPGTQIPDEALSKGAPGLVDHLAAAASEAYDRKIEEIGVELMPMVERDVMLRMIDWQWMEYLTQMEQFREGISLRAYGQRDPLVEYKNEAFEMFNELTERIRGAIVSQIFRVTVTPAAAPQPAPARELVESGPAEPDGSNGAGVGKAAKQERRAAPARAAAVPVGAAGGAGEPAHKIGRNDPCWCGSGKKYKRCHGR